MYLKEVFVLLVAGVVLVSPARWGKRSETQLPLPDDYDEDLEPNEELDAMIEQLEKSVLAKKQAKLEEQNRMKQRLQLISKKDREKVGVQRDKEKPASPPDDFTPNCKRWSLC